MLTGELWLLQMDDQGLVNTDPRTIAVPDYYVNMIPTDVRGLTFSRTPQQVRKVELSMQSSMLLWSAATQSVSCSPKEGLCRDLGLHSQREPLMCTCVLLPCCRTS